MRHKFFMVLVAALSLCLSVQAQTGSSVSGKVVDALGELAGVSVVVKGTDNGTITDMAGEFKLSGVKPGDVLQLSFIGYKTQQVKVGKQTRFNITMVEDAQTLDEVQVVAVGYGTVSIIQFKFFSRKFSNISLPKSSSPTALTTRLSSPNCDT